MNQIAKINNLHSATNEQLKQELGRALDITADYLSYLSEIWRELESRGEDLSGLRHGLMAYIPLIANRQVDSRIVVNYAGQKTLLSAISKLPIEEQAEIARTGHVTVAQSTEDGRVQEVQVNVADMRAADVHRVFGENGIRTPEQQLKVQKHLENSQPRKHITSIIHYDQKDGEDLLVISGKRVRLSSVISSICDRKGLTDSDKETIKAMLGIK